MDLLRTPAARFAGLPDWPWAPRHREPDRLRQHHIDE